MPKYAWICLNKHDSEYALSPKYSKILNMVKFWIWYGSRYAYLKQRSGYARIYLDKVLNISRKLNLPVF